MVQKRDRRILFWLWKVGLLGTFIVVRVPEILPKRRWRWLIGRWFERVLARQDRDASHHAPACGANHLHYRRAVLFHCTCGA